MENQLVIAMEFDPLLLDITSIDEKVGTGQIPPLYQCIFQFEIKPSDLEFQTISNIVA